MAADERQKQMIMAYVDDELDAAERDAFREQMATDPELAREVTEFQNLVAMTKALKLKEPTDYEWDRFWGSLYNRMERGSGWALFALGGTLLIAYAMFEFMRADSIEMPWKLGGGGLFAGAGLLFLSVLRGRLRTMKYDRYRGVKR
ncbi:MAG: zf-HC2 domain-containing protein [Planctomycetota bacterium]